MSSYRMRYICELLLSSIVKLYGSCSKPKLRYPTTCGESTVFSLFYYLINISDLYRLVVQTIEQRCQFIIKHLILNIGEVQISYREVRCILSCLVKCFFFFVFGIIRFLTEVISYIEGLETQDICLNDYLLLHCNFNQVSFR